MSDFGEKVYNGMKNKVSIIYMWKLMLLIEVMCFDDEVYNKKI